MTGLVLCAIQIDPPSAGKSVSEAVVPVTWGRIQGQGWRGSAEYRAESAQKAASICSTVAMSMVSQGGDDGSKRKPAGITIYSPHMAQKSFIIAFSHGDA